MDLPNCFHYSKLKNTVFFLQNMLRVSKTTSISSFYAVNIKLVRPVSDIELLLTLVVSYALKKSCCYVTDYKGIDHFLDLILVRNERHVFNLCRPGYYGMRFDVSEGVWFLIA